MITGTFTQVSTCNFDNTAETEGANKELDVLMRQNYADFSGV